VEASEALDSDLLFQGPLEVFYAKIFLIFDEKRIIHSYKTEKQIISKYFAFRISHKSNYNV